MRSIGLVLLVLGGFIVYLGYKGKVVLAWKALQNGGAAASSTPPAITSNTTNQSPGMMS